MSKIEQQVLLGLSFYTDEPYRTRNFYITDEAVNNCLMDMYMFMLSADEESQITEEAKNELWNNFLKSFHQLNCLQQKIVEEEYEDIIKTQDKYYEEHNGNVKKKGMINYE